VGVLLSYWREPLLLDQVHDGHDCGGLRQLNAQLTHHRAKMREELIESLLTLPHVEDLKLAILTEA
jgi:hypothetical protein